MDGATGASPVLRGGGWARTPVVALARTRNSSLKIVVTVYNFRAIPDLILHRFHSLATCIPGQDFWIIKAES